MKYKRLVTLLAMLMAASVFGQSVERVVFQQQGAYPFSEDIFEMNTQTKAGMPYSERIVNEDVRRLFALGMFEEIDSEVKDLANGNKEVVFIVYAKKNVSEISFKGNRKFSDDELKKLVKLRTDMPLNDALQVESARELRKFYEEKGYTEAQINSSLEADGENSVKVIFNIAEHLRVRVDNVEFEGMNVYKPSEVKDVTCAFRARLFLGRHERVQAVRGERRARNALFLRQRQVAFVHAVGMARLSAEPRPLRQGFRHARQDPSARTLLAKGLSRLQSDRRGHD
jgi:outer membrane protein assembly factor BamA